MSNRPWGGVLLEPVIARDLEIECDPPEFETERLTLKLPEVV